MKGMGVEVVDNGRHEICKPEEGNEQNQDRGICSIAVAAPSSGVSTGGGSTYHPTWI